MKRTLVISILSMLASDAFADSKAEAVALFDQGIKDLEAGNTAQACRELAASLEKYRDSGTKGALAQCYTALGRVASAWQLWRDLADTAPSTELRGDAAANAAQLAKRLPQFIIRVAQPAPPDLRVTINGVAADPSLGVTLPIDPGELVAAARAPGHADWTQTLRVSEGQTITVEVPALRPLSPTPPTSAPPPRAVAPAPSTPAPTQTRASSRRGVIGLALGATGVVAIGAGAYFGLQARSHWSAAQDACGGAIDACPQPALPNALRDYNAAKSNALTSTLLVGAGAAAVLTGVVFWRLSPAREHAVRVAPTIDARSVGLAISGPL